MNFTMMLIISAAAWLLVMLVARVPDMPGHYTDPTWITAAMSAVMMVVVIFVAGWLHQVLQALERLLLILTGVEPEEARLAFQGTLKRMKQLIREVGGM